MFSQLCIKDAYAPFRRWIFIGIVTNIAICLTAWIALDFLLAYLHCLPFRLR